MIQRRMNFELNLVPFIDVLSTCICFLLLTAVFINLGSVSVNQATGTESADKVKKTPHLELHLTERGDVIFRFKDVLPRPRTGSFLPEQTVLGVDGKIHWPQVSATIAKLPAQSLGVATAIVQPAATSKYEDLIQLMDLLKGQQISQLGMAPL